MTGPIRVAQVMGKMVGGGLEAVVMNYYRHVDRGRVQFDFLVDEDSTLVPRDEVESLGGRVLVVPPYQRVAAYSRELERLFREQRWPIVHSHISTLSVFPLRAAKRAGVPIRVAHGHNTAGLGEPAKNALKYMLRLFANVYPTHRLACSRYVGDWLFGAGAECPVLKNAIDLSAFRCGPSTRAAVRGELGIDDDCFVVGHVSRFAPEKNHLFILGLFSSLLEVRPASLLVLVGDGKTRNDVERRARELGLSGKVIFLGQRDDTNRLYQAFDAFVMPSLREGLGLAAIEAQASGLPCFLSNSITREVDITGDVAFLPIGDREPWVDALLGVPGGLDAERRCPSPSAFAEYDILDAAPRLVTYYESLAAGASNPGDVLGASR